MDAAIALDEQLLSVRVRDRTFAIPARLVGEIVKVPKLSRVPNAPVGLLGLANVRGKVVPVLSLARLILGAEESAPRHLVVVDAGEPVALAVDDVRQVGGANKDTRIDVSALIAECMPRRKRTPVARGIIASAQAQVAEKVALVAFRVGSQEFALPLTAIDEIIRMPAHVARFPGADPAALGSIPSRGATLPLLSLNALLALPCGAPDRRTRVLIVRIGRHRIGLVVDAMQEVFWIDPADVDPVPQVLSRSGGETRIQAICRLDGGARLVSVLSPEHLVREDITQQLLQGGSSKVSAMESVMADKTTEQFLVFRIGHEDYGLPIAAVDEIAPLPPRLTPLPKAPAFVQGIMNLRGDAIPVIDQVRRFDGLAASGRKRRVIVVRIDALRAGFVVDAVSEVIRVPAEALRPAPDLGNEQTQVFDRVANLVEEDRLVLIVSPRDLLDRAEQDVLLALRSDAPATS